MPLTLQMPPQLDYNRESTAARIQGVLPHSDTIPSIAMY